MRDMLRPLPQIHRLNMIASVIEAIISLLVKSVYSWLWKRSLARKTQAFNDAAVNAPRSKSEVENALDNNSL